MGCCGKNRATIRTIENHAVENQNPPRVTHTPRLSFQYFEYVGATGITAFGPVTGRRYRFATPGAIVAVDDRDAPSMSGVPNVRRTRGPE
jgi:hypothetical protein